jgi:hypothetical protein
MRGSRAAFRLLGCLTVAGMVAACSDYDGGTEPTANLAGNYTLVSFTQAPNPTLGPPAATGALTLTATRYNVTINVLVTNPPLTLADQGGYAIQGNQWSQTSDNGQLQSTGTYSLQGNVLTVDATAQGVRTVTIWQRQ